MNIYIAPFWMSNLNMDIKLKIIIIIYKRHVYRGEGINVIFI